MPPANDDFKICEQAAAKFSEHNTCDAVQVTQGGSQTGTAKEAHKQ